MRYVIAGVAVVIAGPVTIAQSGDRLSIVVERTSVYARVQ